MITKFLVRADAEGEWFARNGVAVHAVSCAPLNKALGILPKGGIYVETPKHTKR